MQGLTWRRQARFLPLSPGVLASATSVSLAALVGCASHSARPTDTSPPPLPEVPREQRTAAQWIIQSPANTPRPPFRFNAEDDRFLDGIEHASFLYLWNACDPTTGMVYDRSSVDFASTAGVGFQLAAIPAAVERHWITRAEGQDRCLRILRALESEPTNRKAGLFYHYLECPSAKCREQDGVSTIDSALLFAGMITAGSYFGGDVQSIGDRLVSAADWSYFILQNPRPKEPYLKGYITLGWKPKSFKDPTGDGKLSPYAWADAGDEQRLVTFLATAAPDPAHRVDPTLYYRLRRMLGEHTSQTPGVPPSEPHIWFPWSGALFTDFFAHCFIDYAHMGPDDPAAHAVERRPRVDWWENARRAVHLHRAKCIEHQSDFPGFGPEVWGLSACDGPKGYMVPGVYPERILPPDHIANLDYADFTPKDDLGDGTLAPYAAGCSVLFEPGLALRALRAYRQEPNLWRDPKSGQPAAYGFQDASNRGKTWVAPDCVAIDQGPLVLAIENARSGLIWRLWNQHPIVRDGMQRLGLTAPDHH